MSLLFGRKLYFHQFSPDFYITDIEQKCLNP